MIDANNKFVLDLYSELSAENNDGNLFFSPVSISTAFAIADEGANSNTADEIRHAFNFPQNDEKHRDSFWSMIDSLSEGNKEYNLLLANEL